MQKRNELEKLLAERQELQEKLDALQYSIDVLNIKIFDACGHDEIIPYDSFYGFCDACELPVSWRVLKERNPDAL